MDYTGNFRYVSCKRLFRPAIDVLQVEVIRTSTSQYDFTTYDYTDWKDADSADLRNLIILRDKKAGEVQIPTKLSLPSFEFSTPPKF